jgi:hypothetical protein
MAGETDQWLCAMAKTGAIMMTVNINTVLFMNIAPCGLMIEMCDCLSCPAVHVHNTGRTRLA